MCTEEKLLVIRQPLNNIRETQQIKYYHHALFFLQQTLRVPTRLKISSSLS